MSGNGDMAGPSGSAFPHPHETVPTPAMDEVVERAPAPLDQREHRFSHYVAQFFERVIIEPAWYSAVDHSGPVGQKNETAEQRRIKRMRWEQRLRAMGVKPSGLDWPAVLQFDPDTGAVVAACWIELKRGNNQPTDGQRTTMRLLGERKQVAVACWTIHDVLLALRAARFRLHGNADNIAREIEAWLEAADREAPEKLARKAKARGAKPRPAKVAQRRGGITSAQLVFGR